MEAHRKQTLRHAAAWGTGLVALLALGPHGAEAEELKVPIRRSRSTTGLK